MKRKLKILIPMFIIIIGFFLAYSSKADPHQDQMLYTKEPLKIGIIGEIPTVREDNIQFQQLQFTDIENEDFNWNYDAILITKERNLPEAAQDQYAMVYRTAKIPFFFIGSLKGTSPFTEENSTYEDAGLVADNVSFEGVLYKDNVEIGWSNAENGKNPDMLPYDYSNIFQIIYENKHSE